MADPASHVDDLGRFVTNKSFQVGARVRAAAGLGESKSEHAGPYLRIALRDAEITAFKCALIFALGRTVGPGATDDIAPFLDVPSVQLRDLAFTVEGFVGDRRVMERMLFEWSKVTKASRGRHARWSLDVIRYLGRHFDEFDHDRQAEIVRGGHRVWQGLREPHWLRERWPAMASDIPSDLWPAPVLMTETFEDLLKPPRSPSG